MVGRIVRIIGLIVIIISGNSCTKEIKTEFSIDGHATSGGKPLPFARVSIDDYSDWSGNTDESGYFRITNVKTGIRLIRISKTFNDSSFIEITKSIDVIANVTLDSLRLPKPCNLHPPSDIKEKSMKLSWDPSDASDFVEYKLYRKVDAGLDESTGELIYVSTYRNDTSFVDGNLIIGKQYFYRVYQMNNYGRIGGSNMVSAKTAEGNLVPNGDFEDQNSLANWNITKYPAQGHVISLSDTVKKEGKYSLFVRYPRTPGYINAWSVFTLNTPLILDPLKTYQISCWVKGKGEIGDIGGTCIIVRKNNQIFYKLVLLPEILPYGYGGSKVDIDWQLKTGSFYAVDNQPLTLQIYFVHEMVWIDNLTITRK